MKYMYYSSLISMHSKIARAISGAGKKQNNVIKTGISGIGTKFDDNFSGKMYPLPPRGKKYSWLEDDGNSKPSE